MREAWAYRAARQDGVTERGVLLAPSRESAAAVLTSRGLLPIELMSAPEDAAHRHRVPARDLALGFRVLATLLDAGLSITRALAALPELAPPAWTEVLPQVHASVAEGVSLGAALAQSGLDVPAVVVGIVQAGEAGSGLAAAVRQAAELLERAAATRAAVRAALAYPAILVFAGTGAVALLVGVVIPRFAAILGDLGQSLPPITRFVLAVAVGARQAAAPVLVLLSVVILVGRQWAGSDKGRLSLHAMLLRVPVLGAIRRAGAVERVCIALAALLESGVPLAAALGPASRAAGDAAIGARLVLARERIITGVRPWAAFTSAEALTPAAVRLVRAGEESGRLGAMLRHAATLEGDRATRLVRQAVGMLEPAIILVFGGIVAVVATALLQAVYSVRPT